MSALKEEIVYENAPVVEAIIDLRCTVPDVTDISTLEKAFASVTDRFPETQKSVVFEGAIQLNAAESQTSVSHSTKQRGFAFRALDGSKVVQSRLDGFTFSKLKKYERWPIFSPEAYELWKLYIETVKPERVSRIAVRYINRVELPSSVVELSEVMKTAPQIAPKLPQTLNSFFMRLLITEEELGLKAYITSTVEQEQPSKLILIFDIDVFEFKDFSPEDDAIWDRFEFLRIFKNRIFEESFTPEAKVWFKRTGDNG